MKKKKAKPAKEAFTRYTYHDRNSNVPYVVLWVHVREYSVRDPDPDDSWDIGDSAEQLAGYGVYTGDKTSKGYYLDREKALSKEHLGFLPKAGDVVYMVIESYGTGCTFGSTNPCYRPVKIFKTHEDATKWLKTAEADACKDQDYFGGHNEYLIERVVVE